jgi:GNAT superfamily N-acetyltransferase
MLDRTSTEEVRAARPEDLDALVDLSRRTVDRCYRDCLGDATVAKLMSAERIERILTDGLPGCLVIAEGGGPRGLALWEDNLIRLLIIDHRWQRQGLGRRLLGAVESRLFLRHARLWLENYAQNAPGIAFCTRLGWRPVSRYPDGAIGTARLVFEKDRAAA